ncbi:hypothetical protein ACROYT_G019473 [Oculina patagonica]
MMCIFLASGILVSILDRIFTLSGYRSYDLVDKSTSYGISDFANSQQVGIGSWLRQREASRNITVQKRHETKQLRKINIPFDGYKNNEQQNLTMESTMEIFKRDWCRMQRARLEWREVIGPCLNSTVWEEPNSLGINQISDPDKSFISHWDIRQAGEFSRFVIQTVTASNDMKTVGGDSWRIHLHGASSLAPTVFDNGDGTYDVLFLIIEYGDYEAKIFLDYSLCHGFKDPPSYWFKKGNPQGKNQPDGILKGDRPFFIAPFRGGEKVKFRVPPSDNNQRHIIALMNEVSSKSTNLQQYTCDSSCGTMLWDGFGRWLNGQWKPYVKESIQKDRRNREGTFFSFGDSVSNAFFSSLSSGPYNGLCKVAFTACRPVYHWVYDMHGYWGDGVKSPREPLPNEQDYDHDRVISDVKKTLYNPVMDENSVLLLNMGIHFAAAVNFTNYKRVIDQLITLVKYDRSHRKLSNDSSTNNFNGRFIWKTSTALNRERFPNPHKDVRRFLTFPRVQLYNAYATSAMCRAGIDVIDVYPISDSYPAGTVSQTDPVHYADRVFRDVEALLYKMFSP